MSAWTGFTDQELRMLKSLTSKNTNSQSVTIKNVNTISQPTIDNQDRKTIVKAGLKNRDSEKAKIINQVKGKDEMKSCAKTEDEMKYLSMEPSENSPKASTMACGADSTQDIEKSEIGFLSDDEVIQLQRTSLEELQLRQRLMEDQNKKKERMIKEKLQQRFKESQNEAQKLKHVQGQLQHLDNLLQKDVEVLRDKIEDASLLFTQAEHRYNVAEKEYVDSKLDYFNKKETKEHLTEHLYSIIRENEERKSKKLEELLVKLSVSQLNGLPDDDSLSNDV